MTGLTPQGYVDYWRKALSRRMPDELRGRMNSLAIKELAELGLYPADVEKLATENTTADAAIRVACKHERRRREQELNGSMMQDNENFGRFG